VLRVMSTNVDGGASEVLLQDVVSRGVQGMSPSQPDDRGRLQGERPTVLHGGDPQVVADKAAMSVVKETRQRWRGARVAGGSRC